MSKGYLAMVLHAHLPYVRHPEDENFLEERWLYEAITETYIPLIDTFNRLVRDGIAFRLTFSVSPTLLSMLTDELLQQRYVKYLNKLIELSHKEESRTYGTPLHQTALMYKEKFQRAYEIFVQENNCNLVQALKRLQDMNRLEITTCAATHGFLPLMFNRQAIRAQIETAVQTHQHHFGRAPQGIWLPECGYAPGIDDILREYGIRYFFMDSHGLMYATPRPRFGVYAPVYCPSGVAAFGRDIESSKQVWSATEGYPGDVDYREFYRDIGYDLEEEYIKDFIHPDGIRVQTGIKYYRITGKVDLAEKQPYNPDWAANKADIHAANFMFNREKQIEYLAALMERPPLIIAPYDAELFGHWWFEGPMWLELLIKKIARQQEIIELVTPGDYLRRYGYNQVTNPCPSTWGEAGYNHVWLNEKNHWIYRHLHLAADRMNELADMFPHAEGNLARALNQAGRELMLAQSSDWAFIMATGTMVPYAVKRTKEHIANFLELYDQIKYCRINEKFLNQLEWQNNIFPHINYSAWQTRKESNALGSAVSC